MIDMIDCAPRTKCVAEFDGFVPWVGPEFGSGRPRLWVLAESHYGGPECLYERFTADIIDRWTQQATPAEAPGLLPRLAKLALRLPTGAILCSADFRAFYRRIAFSNYVQGIVGTLPRARPTDVLWATGTAMFDVLLNCLDPDAILVVGRGVWDHMPRPPRPERDITIADGVVAPLREYEVLGRSVPVMYVNHPASWGWTYNRWRPTVATLLALAHTRR